jgi:hypothetical protein
MQTIGTKNSVRENIVGGITKKEYKFVFTKQITTTKGTKI